MINMKECVDCLFTEINILTECRHPNVVKILDASFDGTIIKEQLVSENQDKDEMEEYCDEQDEEQILQKGKERKHERPCNFKLLKKKVHLCYYVMKLAEFGELYSYIEHTDRFEEGLSRYVFIQLLEGIKYLHTHGIVHRDIKPENLLINKKGNILIADFSFATRMAETESDDFFRKSYDPIIEKRHNVGSVIYNAPEVWDNEINLQEVENKLKSENDDGVFDYAEIDGKLR